MMRDYCMDHSNQCNLCMISRPWLADDLDVTLTRTSNASGLRRDAMSLAHMSDSSKSVCA